MGTYCTIDNTKAVISVTKNGQTLKIVSNNPPISTTCKNNLDAPDCTAMRVVVNTLDNKGNRETIIKTADAPIGGLRIESSSKILSLQCRGTPAGSCIPFGWYVIGDLTGTSTFFYVSATIESITLVSGNNPTQPTQKGIIIKDKTGAVIYDDDAADCNVNVQCDDDCPTGTYKCSSPIYPGYCCLDCNATAASIRAITNDLRLLNG